jgi:mono/diheme cytochrome c family protein
MMRVGRGPRCELQFKQGEDAGVSWEHASIELKADGAYLSDNGSTNGTFLNDLRVQAAALLRPGDRINLGHKGPGLIVERIDLSSNDAPAPELIPHAPLSPHPPIHDAPAHNGPPPRELAPAGNMAEPTIVRQARSSARLYAAGLVAVGIAAPVLLLIALVATSGDDPAALEGKATVAGLTSGGDSALLREPIEPTATSPDDGPANEDPSVTTTSTATPGRVIPAASNPEPKRSPAPRTVPRAAVGTRLVEGLPSKAHDVLRTTCFRCHGEQGSAEGGLGFVLDRQRLVSADLIVPGDPDNSRLLERMMAGEMPPLGESPAASQAQIATLREWIEAGAPEFLERQTREFITEERIMGLIAADLRAANERDRRYRRYFTLAHLHNANISDDDLRNYRLALAKLINSLSWSREIRNPSAIDPAETVLAIDLRDYDIVEPELVWEEITQLNPYGIVYDSDEARECYAATRTQVPMVRADWFVFKASQPPLYERVLGLPATDRELEQMLKVNVTQNIRQERVWRAGFNGSGVSQNNRLLERHESPYGAYWKSYDFGGNVGSQNLFQHPLGPAAAMPGGVSAQPFQADGGELIFNLPNGLQGYMLADAQGRRIEKGPTSIVKDPRQPDGTVTNGVSCMSCHYAGMILKSDAIRDHVIQNRTAYAEADEILALYPPKEELLALMEEDRRRFQRAVEATGNAVSEQGEPIYNMARRFDSELDLPLAAAEVSLAPREFADRLAEAPASLRQRIGAVTVPGGTVKRQQFADAYGELVEAFQLGRYVRPTLP